MSALLAAIKKGDLDSVKFLVENKADVNCVVQKDEYTNWTPLSSAVMKENTDIVKYLVEEGADIHFKVATKGPFEDHNIVDLTIYGGWQENGEYLYTKGAKASDWHIVPKKWKV